MGGRSCVIIGFLDQILGSGPLIVEPREQSDRVLHIGDEHAIAVLWRVEQLILLHLLNPTRLRLFRIAQGDEPIRFAPALRLIRELALAAGVGLRGPFPLRRFQLIQEARCLTCRNNELRPTLSYASTASVQ